ncbi:hypothetical protein LQZ19_08895 [Treponema primitia]|uniref:hypothetical protein n=1 Tax=Treponema primitia TaxID=88058 RepID=UPI00397E98AC
MASLYMIITNNRWEIFLLIACVAAYTVWNTFISGSNPGKVILEEDGISFESFRHRTKYRFSEITSFRAKDFRGSGKIFLRVNNSGFFKGRFWIHTQEFNDSDELYLFLLKLEYQTHPDSIKARAWDSTKPGVDKRPILPWNIMKNEAGSPEIPQV